jgi:DNA invertase Pin-like site-specific DNA recombinase
MTTTTQPTHNGTKRVIGIVRVSEVGDREPDNLHSPDIQTDRIREACKDDALLDVIPEIDISGRAPLTKRPGLLRAVQAIEAGEADAIMVAYMDRLVRSTKVQQEVVERVEAAGGEVLTLDFGKISNGTAIQRLTSTFLGAVHEYVAEQIREKAGEGQARAVEAGKFIGPVPTGYVSNGGVLAIDEDVAEVVREAFERRDMGATYAQVRAFLAERGIDRTVSGVRQMLSSRAYIGEVNFGNLHNPTAHPPLVDRELFDRVSRTVVRAGRKTKSDRLLARLGVLRCASCDGRMSASIGSTGYPTYRCTSQACARPQSIGAVIVEDVVTTRMKELLAERVGHASEHEEYERAEDALTRAQAIYDKLISLLDPFEPAAQQRLADAKSERDAAAREVDRLRSAQSALDVPIGAAWDDLTLDERRAFIKIRLARVAVDRGRGASRVTIDLRTQ